MTNGDWGGTRVSIFASRLVKELSFENRSEAERFAISIVRPLKIEALQAAREIFGSDLKPFKNKGLKARVFDEIEFGPDGSNRFILNIYLKPAEAWAIGEYGTRDHLIGLPRGYPTGRTSSGNRNAFGQLVNTAQRIKRTEAQKKKDRPVILKAPGYAHPVRGPIVVKGIAGRGAIRYAFKRVREKQTEVVAREWVKYVGKAAERAKNGA